MADPKSFYGTVSKIPQPPKNPKGLLKPGNINIYNRPIVPNPDGGSSTVYSTSFGLDNGEVMVPRVSDGADGRPPHIMSNPEALAYYKKTGQNLGTFDSPANADSYGQGLHEQQAQLGSFAGRTTYPQLIHPEPEPTLQGGIAPPLGMGSRLPALLGMKLPLVRPQ